MKAKLFFLIGSLGILMISLPILAGCCARQAGSCQPLCCNAPSGPELGCRCADIGMYWNYCISKATYCEAFGNVGQTPYYDP